jgi:ADP-ribose pyrophosphatase
MREWKTLSRKLAFNGGKYLIVERHEVQLPDGRILSGWHWIITPDYVNILAITEQNTFLCFRQTKYAVAGTSLAPAGGYLEPGEGPLAAAQRELLEETGYEAPDWIPLGRYPVDGNRGAGAAYLFLARNARQTTDPSSDDLEEQELLHLTRPEVEAALAQGEFKVLAWSAVVSLGLFYMDNQLQHDART